MKDFYNQILFLSLLSISLTGVSQTFCQQNLGRNWHIQFEQKLDSSDFKFEFIDTLSFNKSFVNPSMAYKYIYLNCNDSTYNVYYIHMPYNEDVKESEHAVQTSLSQGIWKTNKILISFKPVGSDKWIQYSIKSTKEKLSLTKT